MNPNGIVGIVLAVVISGTGAAFVTGLYNRRKLGADAAKIITDAAAALAKTLATEREGLLVRIEALEKRVTGFVNQREADREAAILHAAWDHLAVERLKEQGVTLPDPPPLFAPNRMEA